MAGAIISPSSLLFRLHSSSNPPLRRPLSSIYRSPNARSNRPTVPFRISSLSRWGGRFITAIASPEAAPRPLNTDPVGEDIKLGEEGGGGGGSEGFGRGGGGGGGHGDSGGGDQDEEDSKGGSEKTKRMSGMSMSQKLTLGYAALVGVGGVMGYVKSGSQKSLAAGGMSALGLYFVYTQLPLRPALASSLGLGLSAALLGVMGSRFNKSKKIFPAGIVSLMSFVMVAGYFHGILRSLNA